MSILEEKIRNLPPQELIRLLEAYDEYIQQANDDDSYSEGWRPVCIAEFYENEFQELL